MKLTTIGRVLIWTGYFLLLAGLYYAPGWLQLVVVGIITVFVGQAMKDRHYWASIGKKGPGKSNAATERQPDAPDAKASRYGSQTLH